MKVKLILFTVILLPFFYSCHTKSESSGDATEIFPFELIHIDEDGFKKVGNSYQYEFRGKVKNLSSYTFEKVYTTVEIEFTLADKSILTEKEYRDVLSMYTDFGDSENMWVQNETREIGEKLIIESDYIPLHFKRYKISKVEAILIFNCEDIKRDISEEYNLRIDVTNMWEKV